MKISEIAINNYRAFYNEKGEEFSKYRIRLGKGKNLLIYGENGSGKSSLFKGLRDFFISAVDPKHSLIRNVFSGTLELEEEPFVEVTFNGNGEEQSVFRFSHDPHQTNTDDEFLRTVMRSKSFMTYRDLMRIHFVNNPEVNLFDFLFETGGLLTELPNPVSSRPETNLKMGELLKNVRSKPDEINIHDFTNGVNQILSDVNKSLNCLLGYFDNSMTVSFSALTESDVVKGILEVRMNVTYFGIELNKSDEKYHHFLNEARLSALAVCIFLAAHLSVPSAPYRILFLDDIFTGLDTSNRMPLLDILTDKIINGTDSDTFVNHQIILTTYDRQWYELAKNHLGNGDWCFLEMYIDKHTNNFDHPALLPGESDLEKAQFYFRTHQYPACANYQRKICESLIKRFLPDHKKYESPRSGEIIPVTKLDVFIARLESYLKENGLSFDPFRKLKNCLRVVMNPLSHDDTESPVFRRELELVFGIINSLENLKNTVVLDSGKKIHFKRVHAKTGVEREYISQILSPIRKIECEGVIKISRFQLLPLTEQDAGKSKVKISYNGKFEDVYATFCHSLEISESTNPFDDFGLSDGTTLTQLIDRT
ncbi:hypothetical protein FACS189437_06480 [Bacteroidia bacterium]|nr:hypothetical protein FACS189437_06480 [Bacteroidia bacterium]